jgi:hypothetical protein
MRRVVSFLLTMSFLHLGIARSLAQEIAPQVDPQMSVVFDWQAQRCATDDVPDAPLRAVRLADGTIMAVASQFDTRRFLGPDLNHLRRDCTIVYKSQHDPDPSQFADRTWLVSFWTDDGKTIYALDHNEYHADLHLGACQFRTLEQCWYAAIGLVKSTNSGRTFDRVTVEPIAAAPVREEASQGQRRGFANPTNIIKKDGYFYTIIRASGYGNQAQGNCLFRAQKLDDVHSWMLFDGTSFVPSESDPYEKSSGNSVPCAKLNLAGAVGSVVLHQPSGLYFAVSEARGAPGQKDIIGFQTSSDLLKWSPLKALIELPLARGQLCGTPYTYAYPSLIDPSSSSRNFETVSNSAQLYLTRISMLNCGMTENRDLIRMSVKF